MPEELAKLFFGKAGPPDLGAQQERRHFAMEGNNQIGVSRLLELDMAAFGRTCNESSALEGSYRVATGDSGEACQT